MTNLKQRLQNGEKIMGTMVCTFFQPEIINMLQVCGFDYIIIDGEHSSVDYSTMSQLLGRARALNMPTVVRVPEARREVVLKYMEAGAYGLLLPNCNTAEQAKALVEYSKYYPMGNRGVSMMRQHNGYKPVANAGDYMNQTNRDTILMAQIESPESLKNLDEILKVDGIDAAFVGPNDLSQSMGIMGQYDNPRFTEAMDHVISTAKKNNKFSGVHFTTPPETILPYMEKGMSLNLWSNDILLLMSSAKSGLEALK